MSWSRNDVSAAHAAARARFGTLYDELEARLFELDPIALDFETNRDEYAPELPPILSGLAACDSRDAVLALVHATFVRMFDAQMAGDAEVYSPIADWLWSNRTRWEGR